MLKAYLILATSFLTCVVNAQNIDSTTSSKKRFFRELKVAGISIAGTFLRARPITDWHPTFNNIAKTQAALNKTEADKQGLSKQPFLSENHENSNSSFNLRLTFKPKKIDSKKLISYTEFSAGVNFREQYIVASKLGHKDFYDTAYTSYRVNGTVVAQSIDLDLLFTLQTPSLSGTVALYSGLGVYGGVPLDKSTYTQTSYRRRYSPNPLYDSLIAEQPFEKGYYLPKTSLGFYIPVGVKLNMSTRSNIFLEYVFSRHTLIFENNFSKSHWYGGLSFGYRFKFATKPKKDKIPLGTPAKMPEPFY